MRSYISALTKLLVATGVEAMVEIIDLTDPLSVCQNLADFPDDRLEYGGKNFLLHFFMDLSLRAGALCCFEVPFGPNMFPIK